MSRRVALVLMLAAGCSAPVAAPELAHTIGTRHLPEDPTTTTSTSTAPTTTTRPARAARSAQTRRPPTTEPTEGMPGQDVTLACIRQWESGGGVPGAGDYGAVSPSGAYRGAHQWDQPTWDGVARRHRPDLVGVDPAGASRADQDEMAGHLLAERGLAPWPTPARRCA